MRNAQGACGQRCGLTPRWRLRCVSRFEYCSVALVHAGNGQWKVPSIRRRLLWQREMCALRAYPLAATQSHDLTMHRTGVDSVWTCVVRPEQKTPLAPGRLTWAHLWLLATRLTAQPSDSLKLAMSVKPGPPARSVSSGRRHNDDAQALHEHPGRQQARRLSLLHGRRRFRSCLLPATSPPPPPASRPPCASTAHAYRVMHAHAAISLSTS